MLKKRLFALMLVVAIAATFVPTAAAAPTGLTAQAAVVIDFDTGEVLFERDAHTLRVPASMTKSMTAFIVYEEIAAGNLTFDTRVSISENAARMTENNPGSRLIAAGSSYTVDELLHLAMLPSSNRACIALAEHISGSEAAFVTRMNETAVQLGMDVRFANSHGAHDHYATAYAMGILVREFITRHPDILRITNATNIVVGGQNQTNTNRFIHNRQVAGLDGFKTGTLPRAGFCLQATASRGGRRVITVVMNSPNNDRRFADTRTLVDFGFAEMTRRDAARADEDVCMVFVQLNGKIINFDVPARLYSGRALVPMRAIFEALGADVWWDDVTRTITATRDGTVISMQVGSLTSNVNGQTVSIDMPPATVDGRTLVPLRFIAEVFDVPIVWESETRTVVINTEEESEDAGADIDENQAIAILLISAKNGIADDTFIMVLTSVVELVNFYLFADEPVVVPEYAHAYASAIRSSLEYSGSVLYDFWFAMGEDGAVLTAEGISPSGGQWPETEQMVAAALALREIVEQVIS